MAAPTKGQTVLYNGVTLTAAAGDTTSSLATLTTDFGGSLNIKLTNGGTGPTIAAQVQIEVSTDNSEWYERGGPLVGSTVNSAVASWGGDEIPLGVMYLRLLAGSNTGQDVTVDASISEVSGIS